MLCNPKNTVFLTLVPINKSSKFGLKEKETIFFKFFRAESSLVVRAGLDPVAQLGY